MDEEKPEKTVEHVVSFSFIDGSGRALGFTGYRSLVNGALESPLNYMDWVQEVIDKNRKQIDKPAEQPPGAAKEE